MPVYQLIPDNNLFPPAEEAEANGLLAVGGWTFLSYLWGAKIWGSNKNNRS